MSVAAMQNALCLAATLAVLALNVASRQKRAARITMAVLLGQVICQAAVWFLDPPQSLLVFMPVDMLTGIYLAKVARRRPPVWLTAMLFIVYTQCLWHVAFWSEYDQVVGKELKILICGYGLGLNVLWSLLLLCNASPGVLAMRHRLQSSGRLRRRAFAVRV